jgi:predicted metal-binding membrane protein
MLMTAARTERDRRIFLACFAVLIGLAWTTMLLWGHSPHSRLLDHHNLEQSRRDGVSAALFVGGWTIMIVAMMLPTSLPLVNLFHVLVRRRGDRALLVALLVVGYLAIWTAFGVAVYGADFILHEVIHRVRWVADSAWLLAPATLALAGLYQFTPLKYHCLEQCRSPLSFITEHWSGRDEAGQSFRLGLHHGLFCLGCCWSLMLVMFAVGLGSTGWMLVLGAVMAVEKNFPWGRRLSIPLGVALMGLAVVALLTTPPLPIQEGSILQ